MKTMKNKRVKSSLVLMITGALLTASAVIFAANNLYEQNRAEKAAFDALSEMKFDTPLRAEDVGGSGYSGLRFKSGYGYAIGRNRRF